MVGCQLVLCRIPLRRVWVSAAAVIMAGDKGDADDNCNTKCVKVKDLPVYCSPNFPERKDCDKDRRSKLQKMCERARKTVDAYSGPFKRTFDRGVVMYETGLAHGKDAYNKVRCDPMIAARVGAITVAGMSGAIFAGHRGGRLRRLLSKGFFGGFCGVAVASMCYPTEAMDISSRAGKKTWDTICKVACSEGDDSSTDDKCPPGTRPRRSNAKPRSDKLEAVTDLDDPPGRASGDQSTDEGVEDPGDEPIVPEGDRGQSKPEDDDLYSRRSDK